MSLVDDPGVKNHPNIYGVKIGSKYTVVTNGDSVRKEKTCLREKPIDLKGNTEFVFSDEAEGYSDTLYPLKQGIPRNDREMSIAESIRATNQYSKWLLEDIPDNSGLVVCIPLIKEREGLEALKQAIRKSTPGKKGINFFSEAWGAALGTLPIREAVGTNVLTLNFGSSTVEVTLHASKRLVKANVYTFGGSEIDKSLKSAIMQEYRGTVALESDAREIKESYNWNENNDVAATLSLEGAKHDIVIEGDTIRPVVSDAIDRVVRMVHNQFLRNAEMVNENVVTSLQARGKGYIVLCGGMQNMPGFAEELYGRFIDSGTINENVELAVPEDGVTAPAIGAWKVGQVLEDTRIEYGKPNWDFLNDETTDNR